MKSKHVGDHFKTYNYIRKPNKKEPIPKKYRYD